MFSTGQVVEGAVNYTAASSVCGKPANGDDPTIANNRTNLTLPQVQACAQPIGPKWVASITNWLCYVIDGAGLEYASGTVCQDPLLLLDAMIALISRYGGNVIMGADTASPGISPLGPTPPSNDIGGNGAYYIEKGTGTFWGPKQSGSWPSVPAKHGNGKNIPVIANSQILFYNATIVIGPATGASTWITTLPSPINQASTWQRIINNSDANQTIACAGAQFFDFVVDGDSYVDTLTLLPQQVITVVSAENAWVVVEDTLNFLRIPRIAPIVSPDHSSYLIGNSGGNLVQYPIDSVLGLGGGGGGGGGETVDVQTFDASGTWVAPTGAYNANSRMLIEIWGAGGGSCIGVAGYGGDYSRHLSNLGFFNGSESVYVGNGGVGSNNTSGQNANTAGEYSIFAYGRFRNFFAAKGGDCLGVGFETSGPTPERDCLPVYEAGGRPTAIPGSGSTSTPYNTVYSGAGGADWNGSSGTPASSVVGGNGGSVGTGTAANGYQPGGGGGGGTSGGSPSPTVGGKGGDGRIRVTVWAY